MVSPQVFHGRTVRAPGSMKRGVMARAKVDASFGKSKLGKMKKHELIDACRELGLSAKGNKETLANTILEHFSDEGQLAEGETVTMNQAAVMMPPRKMATAPTLGRSNEELEDRIKLLDATIHERTRQLEEMRTSDKKELDVLASDHSELKDEFQRNLETIAASMDDVVALQQSYTKIADLQQEQADLKEAVDGLSRLLGEREEEIAGLHAQLREIRTEQQKDSEALASERLALLALSSAATAPATSDAAATAPAPAAMPVTVTAPYPADTTAPRAARQAIPAASQSDVFGPNLPGLVVCGAGGKVFDAYTTVRDHLVHGKARRMAVDFVSAIALMSTVLSVVQ